MKAILIDPYEVLCIKPGATLKEVKAAYKKLSIRWHPDRADGCEKEFAKISQAYEMLDSQEKIDEQAGRPQGEAETLFAKMIVDAFKKRAFTHGAVFASEVQLITSECDAGIDEILSHHKILRNIITRQLDLYGSLSSDESRDAEVTRFVLRRGIEKVRASIHANRSKRKIVETVRDMAKGINPNSDGLRRRARMAFVPRGITFHPPGA